MQAGGGLLHLYSAPPAYGPFPKSSVHHVRAASAKAMNGGSPETVIPTPESPRARILELSRIIRLSLQRGEQHAVDYSGRAMLRRSPLYMAKNQTCQHANQNN